jgi:hypothetical protein
MGPLRRVKADEESLLPAPTTIEELWLRMNAKLDCLRREIREEGDPSFGLFVQYLKDMYARYRRAD